MTYQTLYTQPTLSGMIDHSNRTVTSKCDEVVIHRNDKNGMITLLLDTGPFLHLLNPSRSSHQDNHSASNSPITGTERDPRNQIPKRLAFPIHPNPKSQSQTPPALPQLYPLLPSVPTPSPPLPLTTGSVGSTPLYPLLPSVSTAPATLLGELKDLTTPLYPLRPSRGTG